MFQSQGEWIVVVGEEEVPTALLGEQDLLSLITMTRIVLVDQRKLVSLSIYCFCVVFFYKL